ncbi:hypothetical protein [Shimia sp. SK013]|uniref:hypothetical protein n=1 Tax=Shimia sp. SK013 TaxID=1389006 RepID=UPI0006B46677|nr:hypothetical protein [Shimia sp. SK013]
MKKTLAEEVLLELQVTSATRVHDYWQICFGDTVLSIYNPVQGDVANVDDLLDQYVVSITQIASRFGILFSNKIQLEIDLSDDAHSGPEAMHLYSPDSFSIVWQ